MKKLFIAEKPSVAAEFAKALKIPTGRKNGYLEGNDIKQRRCRHHIYLYRLRKRRRIYIQTCGYDGKCAR